VYWGLGFGYEIKKGLMLTTEVQRFEFDRDKTDYLRMGVQWYWSDN